MGGFDIPELERKLKFEVTLIDTDNEREQTSTFKKYQMVPCDQAEYFRKNKGGIQNNILASSKAYYCTPNDMKYELAGRFGSNKFKVLRYVVSYCSGRSDCYSPEFIAKNLTDIYFHATFKDFFVDSFDFDEPVKDNLSRVLMPVGSSFQSVFNVYFRELFFSNEEGWVLHQKSLEKQHIYDSHTFSISEMGENKAMVRMILGFDNFCLSTKENI